MTVDQLQQLLTPDEEAAWVDQVLAKMLRSLDSSQPKGETSRRKAPGKG